MPEIILKVIKKISELLKRIYWVFVPIKPFPQLAHLSFSSFEAIRMLSHNKMMNQYIKDKYYADKLVFISGVGNSASTVLGQCVSEIWKKGERGYGSYMRANQDFNLRLEIVRDFPLGGVYRHHFPADTVNLKVLEHLGSKYLINFRNPADIMAAKYCTFLTRHFETIKGNQYLQAGYHNVPKEVFSSEYDLHDSIDYLIKEGYLNATLMWMVDWLNIRDQKKSITIRYEDIKMDLKQTMDCISNFLLGSDVSEEVFQKCKELMKESEKMHLGLATNYPKGWTGIVNAWENYFSRRNRDNYVKQTKNFMQYYPKASLLFELYPDILNLNHE